MPGCSAPSPYQGEGWGGVFYGFARGLLLFGHNLNGTKPPLFWCLQGYRELSQLAKYMGEEQPVYGMRSLHLVIEYTEENLKALAAYYVNEILRVQPDGAYLIGGNCQGGILSLQIANQLLEKGKKVSLLCLYEVPRLTSFKHPVLLLVGKESHVNPYHRYLSPEIGFQKLYPGGFKVEQIPVAHGQFANEPYIQITSKILKQYLDKLPKIELASNSQENQAQILPKIAYQAQIITEKTLICQADTKINLTVIIKNISPINWQETSKSGIMLGNHWLDKNGKVVQWNDGRVCLNEELHFNEEIQLILPITAPTKLGYYRLEIDLVEEGITWFKQQGSQTAIIEVEVIENNQNLSSELSALSNSEQLVNLAEQYFNRGDINQAVIYYQKAINLNPKQNLAVYSNLGNAFKKQGELNQAIIAYRQAIQPPTEQAILYFEIGKIYQKQGKIQEAIDSYQQSIYLDKLHLLAYEKLAEIYEELEQIAQAKEMLEKVAELKPEHPHTYCLLGIIEYQQGNKKKAIEYYQKTFELDPDLLYVRPKITNNNLAALKVYYEQAIKFDERQSILYIKLANILRKLGEKEKDFDQAIIAYSKALEIDKKHRGARLNLVTILNQQQRYLEALEICLESVKIEPENPHFYRQLGNIQRQIGELETAITSYNKAIELDRSNYDTYLLKGVTYQQLGKLETAIETYEQAQKIEPEKPRAYLCLGNAYWLQKDVSKAIESYQKAIEIEPKQPVNVYKNLGDAFNKQGKKEEAISAYSFALKLEPENENVRRILSNLKES